MDLITGKWIGSYVYGDSYGEDLKGKEVSFTMELVYDGELIKALALTKKQKSYFVNHQRLKALLKMTLTCFTSHTRKLKD